MGYKVTAEKLQGVMSVVSLLVFGGDFVLYKYQGIMPQIWSYLPGLSHTMFPLSASKISPMLVSITLLFPAVNLVTAGAARNFLPNTTITKIEPSDIAVYLFFFAMYLASMWYRGVPFTAYQVLNGAVISLAFLSFQLIPYYALHYFDMPSNVHNVEIGVYDFIILVSTAAIFGIIASYAIGLLQLLFRVRI